MPATEHFLRNQKKLHIVFAISCVALLASVIAMMVEDYADPWRAYQATNFKLQAAAKERDIQRLETPDFENQKEALTKQLRELESQLEGYSELKTEVDAELNTATRLVESLALELKSKNALRDEARADYDLSIRDELPADAQEELKGKYEAAQALCDQTQLHLEEAQASLSLVGKPESVEDAEKALKLAELRDLESQISSVTKSIDKLEADLILTEAALTKIKPEAFWMKAKREFMSLPIVEGFNGQQKVIQDWLPDLHQTLGMTSIARFDRCRTCHINIDLTAPGNVAAFPHGTPSDPDDVETWVAENKVPHPFSTHPRHDLFVTASSPHPLSTFGCTSCHEGQGSGTDFKNAEHSPNDPHQQEEWHHEYGYHPNHFWEYPMPPERFQESTCIRCHHSVVELGQHPTFGASAPKVSKGYELIRRYGCFGCHEIHGFDAGKPIGPDMRLEPQTAAQRERVAEDPTQVAGKFRKVGPSLRHIAAKTTSDFIAYWTEIPGRYRPTTKMPQFFAIKDHLSEADAEATHSFEEVELAGIAKVLIAGSEEIDLLQPADAYEPDATRGRQLFTERGCMACHEHSAVPGAKAEFGPNISDIHRKVNRNSDDPNFSDWLYTWLKEPTRYHERTRMPNLYLDPYTQGEVTIDPAADIVAFLLSQGKPEEFPHITPSESALDELVTLYLKKSRFSEAAVEQILASKQFPQKSSDVVGDERVLATEDGAAVADDEDWTGRKLEFVGRRTISRYGCYACHDIPGYDEARPIGVALQDWGRKDTSKLSLEHIEEFLHHHGEPNGSSTLEKVEEAMAMAEDGTYSDEELEPGLTKAYFYESLLHHGRPGFLWQKLRAPRSYDYMKTETKGYDERLRMPKFPLKEDEIEAIATFVLGLVAEPPADKYVYTPDVRDRNRIEGEFLLAKYNCTGCHIIELPEITFGVDLEEDVFPTVLGPADHEDALKMLLEFRKPRNALTGKRATFTVDGEEVELPLASFHGLRMVPSDPEEDPEYRESGFDTWETLDFGDEEDPMRVLPSSRITILDSKLSDYKPARGGAFAEWLVQELMQTRTGGNVNLAWQASPPPLYQEGFKVQTPWLYQFLLEPEKLRYTTVLRMPRFNMSPEEAQTLANYFAAVDGAEFPYQEQKPTEPEYLAAKASALKEDGLLAEDQDYLTQCWKTINGPLCVKCHSLGGRKFKASDPKKDIQGPNINRVQQRLRADWVRLWLYKPNWITPYTSMPVNFPKNQQQFPDIFGGDAGQQVEGVAAGLMNYSKLMEDVGPTVYSPPGAEPAPADAAAGDAAGEE